MAPNQSDLGSSTSPKRESSLTNCTHQTTSHLTSFSGAPREDKPESRAKSLRKGISCGSGRWVVGDLSSKSLLFRQRDGDKDTYSRRRQYNVRHRSGRHLERLHQVLHHIDHRLGENRRMTYGASGKTTARLLWEVSTQATRGFPTNSWLGHRSLEVVGS